MERTASRPPSTGEDADDDETEEANEEAGLGHALATRTPGPKIRRGEADPLRFCMGMGTGMKDTGLGEGLGNNEGDSVGFVDWSGSSWDGLGADVVGSVETGRYF